MYSGFPLEAQIASNSVLSEEILVQGVEEDVRSSLIGVIDLSNELHGHHGVASNVRGNLDLAVPFGLHHLLSVLGANRRARLDYCANFALKDLRRFGSRLRRLSRDDALVCHRRRC